ncbi:MAG TPA: DUF2085 domain-containing protein [Thermoplasmatales archaeon]|nr:DUF2085 domain-containing protein [Thermoplasmatales archaeon]
MCFNKDCVKINKISVVLFSVTIFFTASIFIAPFLVGKGEVKNLDGSAWKVDYREKWDSMPLFPRLIYYFGDINCHQKYYRSYYINENQMPVCARDTGMFIGLSFIFLISIFVSAGNTIKNTVINFFYRKIRDARKILILFFLFPVPAVADVILQMLTPYESINPIRLVTGLFMGMSIAFFVSILFITDPRAAS